LRLHAALSRAKQEYGSREKLVGAVLALVKRSADAGYQARLSAYPLPRLLDLHDSLSKRSARKAVPAPAPAARKTTTKKAKQKAAAA
jgi:hypothetical protein